MKRVYTAYAKPGMKVAGDVYTDSGVLIIPQDTILNKAVIEKLRKYSIFDFFIEEEEEPAAAKEKVVENRNHKYSEEMLTSDEFVEFKQVFEQNIEEFRGTLNSIAAKNEAINIKGLIHSIDSITDGFQQNVWLFDALHCIKGYDDSTYHHSMNVAIISRMIGKWIGYTSDELNILAVAGLLHDVGKIKMPNGIITKPSKLTPTEYAIIKTHPAYGYEILKDQDIDVRIKMAALDHHERCNGTGYPSAKSRKDIGEISRIIAIADVYDAMTAHRVYREGMCPFDVINSFLGSIDSYDPKILITTLERIAESYINKKVLINGETEAKIILVNKAALGRPTVLCMDGNVIDLSKNPEDMITSFV